MAAIQPRSAWGAAGSAGGSTLPNNVGLAVHWEGPPTGVYTQASVPGRIRAIQRYHMVTNGWADIAYNFLVDRYGGLWEGRGWNRRSAANGTNDGNSRYLAVCYLGGDGDDFTPAAKAAIADLFAQHRARGGTLEIVGHRDCTSTACPGDTIYKWVHSGGPTDTFAPAAAAEEPDMVPEDFDKINALIARAAGNTHKATVDSLGPKLDTLIAAVQAQAFRPSDAHVDTDALAEAVARKLLAGLIAKGWTRSVAPPAPAPDPLPKVPRPVVGLGLMDEPQVGGRAGHQAEDNAL